MVNVQLASLVIMMTLFVVRFGYSAIREVATSDVSMVLYLE
jgi:hypothetical protein